MLKFALTHFFRGAGAGGWKKPQSSKLAPQRRGTKSVPFLGQAALPPAPRGQEKELQQSSLFFFFFFLFPKSCIVKAFLREIQGA